MMKPLQKNELVAFDLEGVPSSIADLEKENIWRCTQDELVFSRLTMIPPQNTST